MAEVEYKSNSHKSKEKEKETKKKERDDVRSKLLANRSSKPEKPTAKDAKSIILGDLGMIFTELKDEVIIPGIMDLGKDMWEDMGDRLYETISGRPGSSRSRRKRSSGGSYHAYDGHFKGSKSNSRRNKKPKKISYGRYSIYEVPLKSEGLAEDVIDAIFEQMDEYSFCSIKDYYDFADFDGWEYTDYPQDWGWGLDDDGEYPFDPDDLEIESYKDENGDKRYTITGFPKPMRLD